jgi:hypothetical protein
MGLRHQKANIANLATMPDYRLLLTTQAKSSTGRIADLAATRRVRCITGYSTSPFTKSRLKMRGNGYIWAKLSLSLIQPERTRLLTKFQASRIVSNPSSVLDCDSASL